jgi:hypothetical protein
MKFPISLTSLQNLQSSASTAASAALSSGRREAIGEAAALYRARGEAPSAKP